MNDLFIAIREAATSAIWSKGVALARASAVVGESEHDGEITLKVAVVGQTVSPTVSLVIEDEDWSCDCRSRADPCEHVAASVIALKRARARGEALPGAGGRAPARVAYRFVRGPGGLEFGRSLVDASGHERPLRRSLVTLAAQDDAPSIAASQQDLTVELALGQRVAGGALSSKALGAVLDALRDATEVSLDGERVDVGERRGGWRAKVGDDGQGFRLSVEADPAAGEIFENGAAFAGATLYPLHAPPLPAAEQRALAAGRHFPAGRAGMLVAEVLPALRAQLPVAIETCRLPTGRAEPPRMRFELERRDDRLVVLPTLVYGDPPLARVDGNRLTLLRPHAAVPLRDEEAERRQAARLERVMGLRCGRRVELEDAEAIACAERLRGRPAAELSRAELLETFRPLPMLSPRVATDGEHLELCFEAAEAGQADARAVLAAWRIGRAFIGLSGGGFAPLPVDWLERFGQRVEDLLAARDEASGRLARHAQLDLAELLEDLEQPAPPELARLREALIDFSNIPEATLPADLQATLRDYQQAGVNWLSFLREAGLGALLADDMGLGKTLQALCVLEAPALVVAPTSVLRAWAAELARFRPNLSVCVYHGPARALDPTAEITLTTYALLRLDVDKLVDVRWAAVVLDEAQQIKNPESQVAQAAYQLRADWRLALTGTPVENRLEDLWSLLHFLERGLLGGLGEFRERYARPIEAGRAEAAQELARRTKPFILRREKRAVATELPPRTEIMLHCELSPREREVYEAIRLATRGEVLERLARGGSVLAALEALLRLRQVACDSALVPGQPTEATSTKLALLIERLTEATAAEHKALVFSQWTSLLDRVEPLLTAAGIAFSRLDGSTRDRQGVVEAFQAADGPPVLLISLKAGGVGLTLTAADQVFLLDPWWNPAVEDQAADRVHRIGQTRPVLIQRLVATDTVEERLLALQEQKRALAAAALSGASTPTSGSGLSRDDLLALLE